jgi:hypothetical protein
MHYLRINSNASSVKMFPRLAMTNGSHKLKRSLRPRRSRTITAGTEVDRETARHQVRARLLHMILENERVRRHEQHPNAS